MRKFPLLMARFRSRPGIIPTSRRRMVGALVPIALSLMLAGGCSLLPVEEEAPPPPLLRSYEKTEYEFAEVTRGDIVKSIRITCQYSAALEETLSFRVGNVSIDSVLVSNGDIVKKGDIVATLDRSDLNAQYDAQQLNLEKQKLGRSQLTDTYQLNLKAEKAKLQALQQESSNADADQASLKIRIAAQEKVIETLTNNYKLQIDIYNTRIRSTEEKLANLSSQLDARVLVAGIDGTVTYVKETNPYSTSVENEKFISIADKTSSVFIVSGDEASYFTPGDAVSILLSNEYRDATVVDASELGLEPSNRLAYLQLNETAFDIKERATGSITLVLDQKNDVLQVPLACVKSANGKSIVYMLDENGVKTMREVEVGFTADNKAEILSGLKLGDQIILE